MNGTRAAARCRLLAGARPPFLPIQFASKPSGPLGGASFAALRSAYLNQPSALATATVSL
jgi:hypothetical protein